MTMDDILHRLGLNHEESGAGSGQWRGGAGAWLESWSPIDNQLIGRIRSASAGDYEAVAQRAEEAFKYWRLVPAPQRGEIVRQIGQALREHKDDLGALVTLETGKLLSEGRGEIQEMIDIADFSLGQSRMLYGLSMHSERPRHRMFEQWHPLGVVGVISAFNFPVAVWAWNAMIALVAGNTVVWKPSSKTPLTALAAIKIAWRVLGENNLPEGILSLVIGGRRQVGERLINDRRIRLISSTGSLAMGRRVAQAAAKRLGRTLLELGGNNAIIISDRADLVLALPAVVFAALGTAGQRCTTVRRLIVHKAIYHEFCQALTEAYKQVRIGDPRQEGILMGPLIDRQAVEAMQAVLKELRSQGAQVLWGGEVLSGGIYDAGTYVSPCLCEARIDLPLVQQETFAPILYLTQYETLEEAIALQNSVPQGLSSSIFTEDLREAEEFLSQAGSDCGIANVNVGTSGAEIGGAFGGEKETGGGRESGSDAWKAYMRRQTCTVNWSGELPLAQGVSFKLDWHKKRLSEP
jgi:aldehyde dehydrogenase (NAD+)